MIVVLKHGVTEEKREQLIGWLKKLGLPNADYPDLQGVKRTHGLPVISSILSQLKT